MRTSGASRLSRDADRWGGRRLLREQRRVALLVESQPLAALLLRQLGSALAHRRHHRLEIRVGVLPQIEERGVVLQRSRAVVPGVVQVEAL